jgi:hypothetical protein
MMESAAEQGDGFVALRDGRQVENGPLVGVCKDEAGEIVDMDPLYHDDDGAGLLVVLTRQQRIVVPAVDPAALRLRLRVQRL